MSQSELTQFLIDNPNLKSLQKEIDSMLDSVPEEERLLTMSRLILYNLQELSVELTLLLDTIDKSKKTE